MHRPPLPSLPCRLSQPPDNYYKSLTPRNLSYLFYGLSVFSGIFRHNRVGENFSLSAAQDTCSNTADFPAHKKSRPSPVSSLLLQSLFINFFLSGENPESSKSFPPRKNGCPSALQSRSKPACPQGILPASALHCCALCRRLPFLPDKKDSA